MAEINIQAVITKIRIRPVRKNTWDIEDVGSELAKVSEMDTGDAINFTYKLFDMIIENLQKGVHLNLGKLGVFGVGSDVQGTVKPTFRFSNDIRNAVKAYQGSFKYAENRGLDDEGFARKWLEANPEDTVIMRDDSTRVPADYGLGG